MTARTGGNQEAGLQAESALISSKRSQQSLKTVKDLLSNLELKRDEVIQALGINAQGQPTKEYRLLGGRKLSAYRVVVPYSDFKNYTDDDPKDSKVTIHPLNKRNQKGLTRTALADIIETASKVGIQEEGLAIELNGRYQLIDSSRRFGAARFTEEDLPLWVFPEGTELSDSEVRMLAHITTLKRNLSYREEGNHIREYAISLGDDISSSSFDDAVQAVFYRKVESGELEHHENEHTHDAKDSAMMRNYVTFNEAFFEAIRMEFRLLVSDRTLQRYLDAAMVTESLISLFPDYESINNKLYAPLKQCCKSIAAKLGKPFVPNRHNELQYFTEIEPLVNQWVAEFKDALTFDAKAPLAEQHKQIHQSIKALLIEHEITKLPEPAWSEPVELSRSDKFKYSTIRSHKNGRTHEIKLSRPSVKQLDLHKLLASNYELLTPEQQEVIESVLRAHEASEDNNN